MLKTDKKEIAGTHLKCKRCGGEAVIIENERRYFVWCPTEQTQDILKVYNLK